MKIRLVFFTIIGFIGCKSSKTDSSRRQVMQNVTVGLEFEPGTDNLIADYSEEF